MRTFLKDKSPAKVLRTASLHTCSCEQVRTFLKDKSPAKLAGGGDVDDAFVEATLDQVPVPGGGPRRGAVNSVSSHLQL